MSANFATTRWSLVQRAVHEEKATAERALSELCERYWLPLYGFARRRCNSVEEAQDLTQGFFVELLERELLKRADPERGRFRTFLLAAFQHFMSHEWERQRAAKRGGGRAPLSLDFAWAESRLALESAASDSAEQEFERLWALQALDAAMETVRSYYSARGNAGVFEALRPFLVCDQSKATLAEAGASVGISPGAAKVALHRLRARYGDALRAEIGGTLNDESKIEDEIRRLFAAFE